MFAGESVQDASSYFKLLERSTATLSRKRIDVVADILYRAYRREKSVYLFGNGGSAALASHFACDLGKGTLVSNPGAKRFRVVGLTDNIPTLTAWANDVGYEDCFAEQMRGLVEPGDIAFAVSCSGNSSNVLKALELAREAGATTIGIGGFDGGRMKALCNATIVVDSDNMQIIEDLHVSISHCLFTLVRNRITEDLATEKAMAVGVK